MDRRTFVRNTGLAAVGSAGMACGPGGGDAGAARILITSAEHRLAQALADTLSADHQVLLTARGDVQTNHPFTKSDLGHEEPTNELVQGVGAIVHVAEAMPGEDLHSQIDHLTRCTYNLLLAASEADVSRVVFISTLEMMTAYDSDFLVEERWRPQPSLSAPGLPKYLGEFTCREFARACEFDIVVLRVGEVVGSADPRTPTSIAEEDAVQAVSLALNGKVEDNAQSLGRWAVFHVSSGADARFSSARANGMLGYEPRGNDGGGAA